MFLSREGILFLAIFHWKLENGVANRDEVLPRLWEGRVGGRYLIGRMLFVLLFFNLMICQIVLIRGGTWGVVEET